MILFSVAIVRLNASEVSHMHGRIIAAYFNFFEKRQYRYVIEGMIINRSEQHITIVYFLRAAAKNILFLSLN